MKNLKKVLALGLALVMLLGMFTIAASAATTSMVASDLTDWDTVAHKDAVTLMVDLGIINGKDDGTFAPNDGIDRASWAKMVYYAKTGSDDADAFLNTATGLKDISGNWAESYISYLAANKYISGDENGNYNPDKKVSVAEACKMMLTVLGYDATDRKYQNDASWSGNIMNDAKRFGLMEEVDRNQTALVELTRENAAQIVYNAMKANTVEKSVQWDGGVEHVTGYAKVGTLGFDTFGVIPVEVRVSSVDENGYASFTNADIITENVGAVKPSSLNTKIKAPTNLAGDTAFVWVEVTGATYDEKTGDLLGIRAFSKVITTSLSKGNGSAAVTLTKGFKWTDLTNSAKPNYVATKFAGSTSTDITTAAGLGSVNIYINGDLVSDTSANLLAAVGVLQSVTWSAEDEELPGAVVEFYLNDSDEIETIRAYIYSVAQLTGDAETRTSSAGVAQVRVPGVTGLTSWVDADKVSGYQGLVEGDVVLYYKTSSNNTFVVEKCEKITGVVKNTTASKQIVVDGVKYKRTSMDNSVKYSSGVSTEVANFGNWSNFEDEFDFYLDKAGAVCFTEQVTETVAKSNVALVLAAAWNGTSLTVDNGELQAKLVFIDGTQQVVTVSKLNGKTVVTTLSTTSATAEKQIVGGNNDSTTVGSGTDAIDLLQESKVSGTAPAFYNYKVVDGKYELTKVVAVTGDSAKDDDWAATEVFTTGTKINQKGDFSNGATTWTADSKTVFLVAKGEVDSKTYYTYTSYKNIPEMNSATGMAVGTHESGAAKYVYLNTVSYSDDVPDGYVFVINKGWTKHVTTTGTEYFDINIINADGEEDVLKVDETIKNLVQADKTGAADYPNNTYVGKFCSIDEKDESGIVSKLTPVPDKMDKIGALGNEVVTVGNDTYAYDDVTKFVYVDMAVNDGDNADSNTDDTIEFSGAAALANPNNFWRAADIDWDYQPGEGTNVSSGATKSFSSVYATVISADGEIADYVYIVRVLW